MCLSSEDPSKEMMTIMMMMISFQGMFMYVDNREDYGHLTGMEPIEEYNRDQGRHL